MKHLQQEKSIEGAPRGPPQQRLRAYRLDGTWVCLAGVGQGAQFGTFPRNLTVRQLTNTPEWVEVLRSPAGEPVVEGIHWQPLRKHGWVPKTVVMCRADGTGTIGVAGDEIGSYMATHIQLLDTQAFVEVCRADPPDEQQLMEVRTPPTPDPFDCDHD